MDFDLFLAEQMLAQSSTDIFAGGASASPSDFLSAFGLLPPAAPATFEAPAWEAYITAPSYPDSYPDTAFPAWPFADPGQ